MQEFLFFSWEVFRCSVRNPGFVSFRPPPQHGETGKRIGFWIVIGASEVDIIGLQEHSRECRECRELLDLVNDYLCSLPVGYHQHRDI